MNTSSRTWLITGVSSGIGRALAEAALGRGDKVWGSVRQADQAATFDAIAPGRSRALIMDVTRADQVKDTVAKVLADGPIDVLVNNAGFGMVGTAEETSIQEAREIFETNFFGLLQVTQAVLPTMRQRGCGHIINVSSGVGLAGMPGMALYSATKHAVEGLTDSMAVEVGGFGVRVSMVEPGAVLTKFTGQAMREAAGRIPVYAAFSGHGRAGLDQYYQAQAASPEHVASAILALADDPNPPVRQLVGQDVLAGAKARMPAHQALIDRAR